MYGHTSGNYLISCKNIITLVPEPMCSLFHSKSKVQTFSDCIYTFHVAECLHLNSNFVPVYLCTSPPVYLTPTNMHLLLIFMHQQMLRLRLASELL